MDKADAQKKSLEYLERVGLADKANSYIKKLSSGQQQKIQLGITVLNSPKLLILDEPTKGLDPVNRSLLMDVLRELNASGSTIMFSTHQMDEAEKIADRLLLLKDGRAALYGQIDEVKRQFGTNTIHMSFNGTFAPNDELFTARVDQHFAEITPKEGKTSNEILTHFLTNNLEVTKFEISAPSLNEIFIKVSTQHEK
jgi:ABC-2 type transport system ATP-binding protein